MTTINALLLEDEVYMSSDSQVTKFMNGDKSPSIINSKKIVASKVEELNVKTKEVTNFCNLLVGFAGNDVSLIESFKSSLDVKIGTLGDDTGEDIFHKVIKYYKKIFTEILSNHIFEYYYLKYENVFNKNSFHYKEVKTIVNTEVIIAGYSSNEKKHKVFVFYIDDFYNFQSRIFSKNNTVVTIGEKKMLINNDIQSEFDFLIKENVFCEFESSRHKEMFVSGLLNTFIMNYILDEEYSTIGGSVVSYIITLNDIREFYRVEEESIYEDVFKKASLCMNSKNSDALLLLNELLSSSDFSKVEKKIFKHHESIFEVFYIFSIIKNMENISDWQKFSFFKFLFKDGVDERTMHQKKKFIFSMLDSLSSKIESGGITNILENKDDVISASNDVYYIYLDYIKNKEKYFLRYFKKKNIILLLSVMFLRDNEIIIKKEDNIFTFLDKNKNDASQDISMNWNQLFGNINENFLLDFILIDKLIKYGFLVLLEKNRNISFYKA